MEFGGFKNSMRSTMCQTGLVRMNWAGVRTQREAYLVRILADKRKGQNEWFNEYELIEWIEELE